MVAVIIFGFTVVHHTYHIRSMVRDIASECAIRIIKTR
jgi:hypothetical protein